MSLVACKECGGQVSTEARECPHCGIRRTSDRLKVALWLTGGTFALFLTIKVMESASDAYLRWSNAREETARLATLTPAQREQEAKAKREAAAREAATKAAKQAASEKREAQWKRVQIVAMALKRSLHDPASVEWDQAWLMDNGTVALRYRARNAFGAKIINVAVITQDGKADSGTEERVAALWNRYVAGRKYDDFTSTVRGAERLGAL